MYRPSAFIQFAILRHRSPDARTILIEVNPDCTQTSSWPILRPLLEQLRLHRWNQKPVGGSSEGVNGSVFVPKARKFLVTDGVGTVVVMTEREAPGSGSWTG